MRIFVSAETTLCMNGFGIHGSTKYKYIVNFTFNVNYTFIVKYKYLLDCF